MYASKRSIRKAQGNAKKGTLDHNNKKVTPGRLHRIQVIKDEHGFIKKTLYHFSPRKLKAIQQYSEALAKYKAAQMVENGEVPVVGDVPKGATDEAPQVEEVK